jgi:hypothetical protein
MNFLTHDISSANKKSIKSLVEWPEKIKLLKHHQIL